MISLSFLLLLLAVALSVTAKQAHLHTNDQDDPPKHDLPTSPPVYPSPQQTPISSAWKVAIRKAHKAVSKLSLEEKVQLGTGAGWPGGLCFAVIKPIESIGLKGLCIHDGPLGVRAVDLVSAFPAGINAASTFDRDLIRRRGEALGTEYREKGINVYLGPMNNIMRTPWAGRNWEGFGADPYLSGEVTYETIIGVQSKGVQCNAKHYINNEQERDRGIISSNVDDRTQHEIYLPPFLKAVQADVASIMASYNRINGSWATQNAKTLNGILKGELGFPGYVLSDFFGTQSGVAAVNAGLDMPVPIGAPFFGDHLVDAVKNGSVNASRVDDLATRVLSAWYLTGQDKLFPEPNFNAFDEADEVNNKHVDVQHDHYRLIREMGAASHVLLKNVNHTLPLKRPRNMILVGSDAGPPPLGPNFYHDRFITPSDRTGVLAMGWGSGTCYFPYLIDPLSAIQKRAQKQHIALAWLLDDYDPEEAARQAKSKEVAIVFIMADSGEATNGDLYGIGDRPDLEPWHNTTALVLAVASANPNTIVVVHSVGPITMSAWIDHPSVKAVLWAGLQGQEVGEALAEVLFGDVNPSGRLPYTIARRDEDYGARIEHDTDGWEVPQTEYKEGLLVDYRWFDAKNITPLYPFGHGLSYTTFTYGKLWTRAISSSFLSPIPSLSSPGPIQGASVAKWLHEKRWEVKVLVRNEGKVAGHEVVQLYVAFPIEAGEPPKALKGFERVYIKPGQTRLVHFSLSYYDLSIWDVVHQRWTMPKGSFGILVGASSRDIRVEGRLEVDGNNRRKKQKQWRKGGWWTGRKGTREDEEEWELVGGQYCEDSL